jgi:hypothetical protein
VGEKKTDRKAGMETLLDEISRIFEATPFQSLRPSVLISEIRLRKMKFALPSWGR